MNPLLDFSGLPPFSAITPAHVDPAISQLIAEAHLALESIATSTMSPTWDNVVTPLDDVTERLSRAWGVVGHLNAVVNAPALRAAYNGMLPAVAVFWTALSHDARLLSKSKKRRASSATFALVAPRQ